MRSTLLAAALCSASALLAQTAQTVPFRSILLAANESAPAAGGDSGAASILVHVVEDASGNILSGSVDINLTYQFPNDELVTGLGIVNAPAGKSGPFVFATNITSAGPVHATAGSGRMNRQVQVAAGDTAGLATLKALLAAPTQYSVSVLSSDSPAGAMSGGLLPAKSAVLMAVLSSSNAQGVAAVSVLYTGSSNAITSGEVALQASYRFPAQVTFSSMRIYTGQGQSGSIEVAAALVPGTLSAPGGTGVLTAPAVEIDMKNLPMVQGVENLLRTPGNFSADIGTVENAGAPLSGQLRTTDSMTFQIPNVAGAGAASAIQLHTLRLASGDVQAGTVIFDVNYRLPAGTKIAGLDIDADITAPAVTADPSGAGNVYALVLADSGSGLTSLNGIVSDPESHHIDLQASSSPSVLSGPLAPADSAPPVVAAVIPIVEDKNLATFAPGELVEIYGTNLAKVTADLSGWPGISLPASLNGVSVTVGGLAGRILYVSPGQVDALLPFDSPVGSQSLSLNNGNGPGAPLAINVVATAPALYNFAFQNADFSKVTSSHPAKARDLLVFYATGMGQTKPALATGQIVPLGPPFFDTPTVTVTIGGLNANVTYSIASPPYVAGLYQMAVTVPDGLGPGSAGVVATAGGVSSNTITIAVQ